MKRIPIKLTTKSIKEAQNYLLNLKRDIPKMIAEFNMLVAHWVTDRANDHIDLSDIGSLVKKQIKDSWDWEPTENGVLITNNADKAVFVEFGVGIEGQHQSHPNADVEGYEYNVSSPHKDQKGSGTWIFKSKLDALDIPQKKANFIKDNQDYAVITRGTKGAWYAYNAIVDAQNELSKSNCGKIGELWETVIRKYIK